MILFFFVGIVLVTVALILRIVAHAAPPSLRISAIVLGGWLALTLGLAASGVLRFGPMPPPILLLVGFSFVATTAIALSPFGGRLANDAPLGLLIGFQMFRIAVELFLDLGFHDEFVPEQMTWEGSNWDVISGITAAIAAWYAARGTLSRRWALIWNSLGTWLLANIVVVAVLSMPTPLQAYHYGPSNTFVVVAPYVWLPTVLVQAAWFGHLLVFRRLLKG